MEFQQNQLVVWSASYFDLFTAMLSILFVTYFYQLLVNLINSTWSQRYGDKTKSSSQETKKKWQIRSQNNRNTIIHPPLYQTISSSTNLCIQSAFKAAYCLVRVTPSTRVPRTAAHHLSRLLLVPMEKAFELSSLLSRISLMTLATTLTTAASKLSSRDTGDQLFNPFKSSLNTR